jgi:hypothetical protein
MKQHYQNRALGRENSGPEKNSLIQYLTIASYVSQTRADHVSQGSDECQCPVLADLSLRYPSLFQTMAAANRNYSIV